MSASMTTAATPHREDALSFRQGVVCLPPPHRVLVGHRFKDDFSPQSHVCAIPDGEPVVQIGARGALLAPPAPPRRAAVLPALTEELSGDESGAARGAEERDHADVREALGSHESWDQRHRGEEEDGEDGETELEARRIRVWVPRLQCIVWLWQRTTDGRRTILWLDASGLSPERSNLMDREGRDAMVETVSCADVRFALGVRVPLI